MPRHGLPTAIVVALVMSAAYGIAQILFWATPDVTSPTSLMVLWLKPLPGVFEATRILLLVGWGLAAVLGLSLALRRGAPRPIPRPTPGRSAPTSTASWRP